MKGWHRIALCIGLGVVGGTGLAIHQVRGGMADGTIRNGPWTTSKSFGTEGASALLRARVALTGILALPSTETLYFTAKTDSEGRALDGRCRYTLSGTAIPARWWSITLYQGEGWLVKNSANRWSIGSAAIAPAETANWTITVSPAEAPGHWLPTGNVEQFDMTLRAYHPGPELSRDPAHAALPVIKREGCA